MGGCSAFLCDATQSKAVVWLGRPSHKTKQQKANRKMQSKAQNRRTIIMLSLPSSTPDSLRRHGDTIKSQYNTTQHNGARSHATTLPQINSQLAPDTEAVKQRTSQVKQSNVEKAYSNTTTTRRHDDNNGSG